MAFINNQTQLELKAGSVVGPLRDNIVAEAADDAIAIGSLVGFDATGKLVKATNATVNPHVAYRNNGFKEVYNTGDSINIANDGVVYLKQEAGQALKIGQDVQVGTDETQVIVKAAGVKVGTVQQAPTTNGLVRVKLGA